MNLEDCQMVTVSEAKRIAQEAVKEALSNLYISVERDWYYSSATIHLKHNGEIISSDYIDLEYNHNH